MKYFGDNSLAKLIALVKDTLSAHTDDASIHVTAAEKEAWDGAATVDDVLSEIRSHNRDEDAHKDIREAVNEAGKAFVIEGTLVDTDSDDLSKITDVSKSRAEVKAAVQAGESVMLRLGANGATVDLPLTEFGLTDDIDFYYFGAILDGLFLATLYYIGTEYQAMLSAISIPSLSDDTPSAPGTASAGTSEKAARADHVHPSERPKATLVTLSSVSWDASTKTQTVDVAGIDADESKQMICVMPYSADTQAYKDAGIQMSAQAAGKATFICSSVPESDVKAWVVVEDVEDVTPPPCLTFSSPSAFSISVATPGWDGTMEYSSDKSTWNTWDGSEITALYNEDNYSLYVRGSGNTKIGYDSWKKWTLTGSNVACHGNIETLLDYAAVANGDHPSMAESCYSCIFYEWDGLTSAPELPATTLADKCYSSMFYGCTGLTVAPALPATTLANYCYSSMFLGCTGLTSAPELPATTLATACYYDMFHGCTSLITAPALPATTLGSKCYYHMFYGCTGLTTAPALPATTLADECYSYMFYGCTGLTTAPALPATTLADYCYNRMFYGCTGLTAAPALPATTLAGNCYNNMFRDCTGLTTAPALPATTLPGNCYYQMFNGCTGLKLSATQTGTYTKEYRIPISGTGTTEAGARKEMFINTGGTFTGAPAINTTYYLDASNSIV